MKNTIKNYLMENMEEVQGIVAELNSWDGSLEHLDFLDMEELDTYLEGLTPTEILNKMYYGDFNPNHEYFQFNGYENLVSFNDWDVEEYFKTYIDDIVEALIENYTHIYIPDELLEILEFGEDEK